MDTLLSIDQILKQLEIFNENKNDDGKITLRGFYLAGLIKTNNVNVTINDKNYLCNFIFNNDEIFLNYENIKETDPNKFILSISNKYKIEIPKPIKSNYSWNIIRYNNKSLNDLQKDYKKNIILNVKKHLKNIEGVWGISRKPRNEDNNKTILTFTVYIESEKKLNELTEKYKLLSCKYITIIKENKANIELDSMNYIHPGAGIFVDNKVELEGTIGCFCKDKNNNHYAITCNHVINSIKDMKIKARNNPIDIVDPYLYIDLKYECGISGPELDIALLKVESKNQWCILPNLNCNAIEIENSETGSISSKSQDEELNNPFDPVIIAFDKIDEMIQEGRKFYIFKNGSTTGLTTGSLESVDESYYIENVGLYEDLITVKWINDIEFADHGDSGSLYYIIDPITHYLVPMAIHVASNKDKRISYGVTINKVFDELSKIKGQLYLCNSDCLNNN